MVIYLNFLLLICTYSLPGWTQGQDTCAGAGFTTCCTIPSLCKLGTCSCDSGCYNPVINDCCPDIAQTCPACQPETVQTESGITYVWQQTVQGQMDTFTCPLNGNTVTRNCNSMGIWEPFDQQGCGTFNEVVDQLRDLFGDLNQDNYGLAVSVLSQVIERTVNDTDQQSRALLNTVAGYLNELSEFVMRPENSMMINQTVVEGLVNTVGSLVQWDTANIVVTDSSSVVESFEVVASSYAQQLSENETQTINSPTLILVPELRRVQYLQQVGRSFSVGSEGITLGPAAGDQMMPSQLSPGEEASINLPSTLFNQLENRSLIGIFYGLYTQPTLFPISTMNTESRQTNIISPVLATTVGPNIVFENLPDSVTVTLRTIITNQQESGGQIVCVTWDFEQEDWISDGCITSNITQDGIVTCNCNHLTNFAVIVDICLRQDGCEMLNEAFSNSLAAISYIGFVISIVSAVLTIITMLAFKNLREKDVSKYHVQLSLAILLMLLVTLVLVGLSAGNVTPLYGGCILISSLTQYFTLVAVMWMGAEALLMFQKLVFVFSRITTKFIIIVSLICWTVPFVAVLLPLITDLANGFDVQSDIIIQRANSKEEISFCFLSHIGAFWGAFVVPIFIIMIFNIIIFICVIVVLIRHVKDTAARMHKSVEKKTIVRLMFSISGVMFLFGLTWLFAIFTFSTRGLREVGIIFFTIFNSLQGLFIFIFFCLVNEDARNNWKALISRGMVVCCQCLKSCTSKPE